MARDRRRFALWQVEHIILLSDMPFKSRSDSYRLPTIIGSKPNTQTQQLLGRYKRGFALACSLAGKSVKQHAFRTAIQRCIFRCAFWFDDRECPPATGLDNIVSTGSSAEMRIRISILCYTCPLINKGKESSCQHNLQYQ